MLNLYLETEQQYLQVPNIDEFIYVDIRGKLHIQSMYGFISLETPLGEIDIHIQGVRYRVPVINLVQVTWKPVCPEDFIYYLTERVVVFTDRNPNNCHPINLIWSSEISKVGDMYRIPGFSWYLLTEDNQVYSRVSKKILSVTLIDDRHASAYIAPDCKNGKGNTITIHRMVAFAKIPYNLDVCNLEVNHIDGDKWNYATSNLEWVTRRQNNLHAQITGLKNDSNRIKVTDMTNGSITEYYSQAECGRNIGIDPRNLSLYLRKFNGVWTYRDRYKVELIKVGLEKPKYVSTPRCVVVKDLVSGEIHEFPSLAKSASFVGMSVAALKKRHVRGTTVFGNMHLKTYNPLLGEPKPTFDE